ncbi:hypothetical protein E1176_19985 [Fulvivirga sp. RKSG066]|uniref:hypothetical protein n=1 Tax=Fulvivirga aurantia TaxID=2529383 RepID=UPI0012BBFD68|nr:hypothetical protein [Fulvivirga aurantia]MTI23319.1 hypothetical protein [Fulvivirga aurantia]
MIFKINLLTLTFIITALSLQAQDYIVTLQRDTIQGEVDILLPDTYSENLVFQNEDQKKQFMAQQLYGVYDDSAMYNTVKLSDKYRLMKVIEGGYLTYYLYRADQAYDFSLPYLQKSSTEGIEVPTISFRKKMTDFLKDCPAVVEKIDSKEYKRGDLSEIVRAYNACLNTKTEDIYTQAAIEEKNRGAKEIINDIIAAVDKKDNADLITMLNDIKNKLDNGDEVPGYLTTALKDQTKDMEDIQKHVNELLGLIK